MSAAPPEFIEALSSLREVSPGADVLLTEVPAPGKLAPYAGALVATKSYQDSSARARLVILYDPAAPAAWAGKFRLVLLLSGDIEEDLGSDPLFSEVAWTWLAECLNQCGAGYHHLAGTVTRQLSHSFGGIKFLGSNCELELRASWTPNTNDLAPHLQTVLMLLGRLTNEGSGDFFGQND